MMIKVFILLCFLRLFIISNGLLPYTFFDEGNMTYLVHKDAREGCYLLPTTINNNNNNNNNNNKYRDEFTFKFLRDHEGLASPQSTPRETSSSKRYIELPSWFTSLQRDRLCVNISKSLKMTDETPDDACRLEVDFSVILSGNTQSSPFVLVEKEFGSFRNPSIQYLDDHNFFMISRTTGVRMYLDTPLFHLLNVDAFRNQSILTITAEPIESKLILSNYSLIGYEDSRMLDVTHLLLTDNQEIRLAKDELVHFFPNWGTDGGRNKLFLVSTTETTHCDKSLFRCHFEIVNRMKHFFLAYHTPTNRFLVTRAEHLGVLTEDATSIHRQREKNWTPFVYNSSIMYVHEIFPLHVISLSLPNISTLSTASASDQEKSPHFNLSGTLLLQHVSKQQCSLSSLPWMFGEPRGGSPAILIKIPRDTPPIDNMRHEYLAFFHAQHRPASTVIRTRESAPISYWIGAYTFSPHPPFRMLRMSHVPILKREWYDGPWVFKRGGWGYVPYPMSVIFERNKTLDGREGTDGQNEYGPSTILVSIGLQEGRQGILSRIDLQKVFRTMAIVDC